MEKEELLNELYTKMDAGEISREEIAARFGLSTISLPRMQNAIEEKTDSHFTVTKMLYVLGAGIVLIGILIFMAQLWDDMGTFGHIAITLGLGLLLAASGSILLKQTRDTKVGQVFHAIGGFLIPGGVIVALVDFDVESAWAIAVAFTVVFAFYVLLMLVHRSVVLTLFAIANGTAAIYLICNALLDPILSSSALEIVFQYLTMALGLSYLAFSRSFVGGYNEKLISSLYFLGITGLLAAAFYRVLDSTFWEFLYFFIVAGGLFLSIYMKSRIILIMSTIFLITHIFYITSEYFADSLGWPVVLVILGFVFIGLGYISVTINNKYIKGQE